MKYGRQTQYFRKLKTTSFFLEMEDDPNNFENGRRPHFLQMEDDFNIFESGRRLHFFDNGRQPFFLSMEDSKKIVIK
jgi:hypothetical protein